LYHKLFESTKEQIIVPNIRKKTRHNFQTYCILLKQEKKRDKLISYLKKLKIEAQIGSYALHLQPAFSKFKTSGLANSEFAYKNGLAVPLHGKLTYSEQKHIVNKITKFLGLNTRANKT